ncbi:hypothetical protein F2Q68_00026337 [Brassica cretica]|uniref:Uncharacterized protein n=1 Tax=Brassica cretica TaxID=69181 RepID=A0A8S9IDF2_BRACR|nr:hypothetical protein F2Q68_00026337 [Brassica cretica]
MEFQKGYERRILRPIFVGESSTVKGELGTQPKLDVPSSRENKLEAQVSNLDLVGQTVVLKEVDETYMRVTADSTEYGCAYHGGKIVGGIQKLATEDASGSNEFLTIRFGVLLRQNSGNGFGARMSLEVNEDEEKIRYEE